MAVTDEIRTLIRGKQFHKKSQKNFLEIYACQDTLQFGLGNRADVHLEIVGPGIWLIFAADARMRQVEHYVTCAVDLALVNSKRIACEMVWLRGTAEYMGLPYMGKYAVFIDKAHAFRRELLETRGFVGRLPTVRQFFSEFSNLLIHLNELEWPLDDFVRAPSRRSFKARAFVDDFLLEIDSPDTSVVWPLAFEWPMKESKPN